MDDPLDWPLSYRMGLIPALHLGQGIALDQALINYGFDLQPTKPLNHNQVAWCMTMKWSCPTNCYDTNTLMVCRKGHVTRTAIFTHNGPNWCPHEKCDGIDKSFRMILYNQGKSEYTDANLMDSTLSPDKVQIACRKCHFLWITDKETVIGGKFCDRCLEEPPNIDEARQRVAQRIGGRYNNEDGTFYCYMGEALTTSIVELARGLKCHKHEECKCMRIMLSEGKNFQNEVYVMQRLKLLAKLKNGELIGRSETANKFEWVCHEPTHREPHKWTMSMGEFLFGFWCPLCKPPPMVQDLRKKSRGK
jgi:hypothetical protein